MDFLQEYGIDNETIKKIIENNDEMLVNNIEFEKENIVKNLNYFKEIGIKKIENLLVERLDLFFVKNEVLKETIEKYNIKFLVKLINEDFANIELMDIY